GPTGLHGARASQVVAAGGGAKAGVEYFDRHGFSNVAGRAVLLPRGDVTPDAVGRAAAAGAAAVLVDGPIPAGALGADAPGSVPVLGVPQGVADEIRRDASLGRPVELSVGGTSVGANPELGTV